MNNQARQQLLLKAAKKDQDRSERAARKHVRNQKMSNVTIAVAIAFVVVLSALFFESGKMLKDFARITTQPTLENPNYEGVDGNGNPYAISAKLAYPDSINPKTVDLEYVRGTFVTGNGDQLFIHARTGFIEVQQKRFSLAHDVVLTSDTMLKAKANNLVADLERSQINLSGKVELQNELGFIHADNAVIYEREGRALFTGGVRTLIQQAKQ